jgi:dUTP pyrophosphatase
MKVVKMHPDAIVPNQAHIGDAGFDLCSVEDITIDPNSRALVSTGIAMEIPFGAVGLIWPRSGLAVKQGLDVFAGVIDSGYRGEIKVCLFNSTDKPVQIAKEQKIAQILFQEHLTYTMHVVESFETATSRGANGFGSTD